MGNTYSAVTTPVTGNAITVAAFGGPVAGDLDYLAASKPNVRAFNSANISIATSGVAQALTFDSERYDKGAGSHSTVTNTGRLTVPTGCAGVYLIGATVTFASNATGNRQIYFRLNGTTLLAVTTLPTCNGELTTLSLTTSYALVATDYVEVLAYQTSGGALNVTTQANYSPEFWWIWQST